MQGNINLEYVYPWVCACILFGDFVEVAVKKGKGKRDLMKRRKRVKGEEFSLSISLPSNGGVEEEGLMSPRRRVVCSIMMEDCEFRLRERTDVTF